MTLRRNFYREIERLQDDVLILGSMVEGALTDAIEVLKQRDMNGSQRLIQYDEKVNQKRFAIEEATLTLIATQQPIATDMRVLAAILEIITELERIGDYAKGIAVINLRLEGKSFLKPFSDIPLMADQATHMLRRALDAFVQRDMELAQVVAAEDDKIDDLYNKIYRNLVETMTQNTGTFDQATYLLWVAHNLERTGDRIVNICERIIFTVTGNMVEMNGHQNQSIGLS